MGTYIDLASFAKPAVLLTIVVFTAIAVVTKYFGAIWGARREGRRIAREVGVGMVPRGEVGIVVAGIALAAGAVTEDVYAAVLGMVLATTVISPYLIKAAFGRPTADGAATAISSRTTSVSSMRRRRRRAARRCPAPGVAAASRRGLSRRARA